MVVEGNWKVYRMELPSGFMESIVAVESTWPYPSSAFLSFSTGMERAHLDHMSPESRMSRHSPLTIHVIPLLQLT